MAGLSIDQINRFEEDGYLIVPDCLTEDELAAIEIEYREIVERVTADMVARGLMTPIGGNTFAERYVEALGQVDDMYTLYQHLDICLPLIEDLDQSHTMNAGPAVFRLLTSPRLLDIAESLIGPEIYSNPVQHARLKPPVRHLPDTVTDSNIAATEWHQDASVVDTEADQTDMLTVWLAITDATVENGCLIAVAGSHKENLTLHCPGTAASSTTYIPEALIDPDRVVPLEVKAGGAVLLHKMTEHASLENHSDGLRWSFDLRYQPIGQPTGRSIFPGFVARSRAHPEQVLTDPQDWKRLWDTALNRIVNGEVATTFNTRWDAYAQQPLCA